MNPELDVFLSGWDMFDHDGSSENVVEIKLNDKGQVISSKIVIWEGMMYPRGYNAVQKKYPNIVDIR